MPFDTVDRSKYRIDARWYNFIFDSEFIRRKCNWQCYNASVYYAMCIIKCVSQNAYAITDDNKIEENIGFY